METAGFSPRQSQDNWSGNSSLLFQNTATNLRRQSLSTGIKSTMSYDFIHTPVFNKQVLNRHLIDQGLDISRHKSKLENRQVKDKSYYMGLLYRKGYEIGAEIKKMTNQIHLMKADQSTHLSCKQKAENQASELMHLQEILSDYNLVDDMYNTDSDIDDAKDKLHTLKADNELQNTEIEKLFELNKKKEDLIHELETDVGQEKYVTDILSVTSSPNLKKRYKSLKKLDEGFKSNQMKLEEELKSLKDCKKNLEEQCSLIGKSELFSLMKKLSEEQLKKDNLIKEHFGNDKSSLIKKKREYNDLIKCLGNETRSLKLQIQKVESELEISNKKTEDVQAERIQKLAKLKTREKTIDNFLSSYPETQIMLMNQITNLQNKIKILLQEMSSLLNFDGLGKSLKNGYFINNEKESSEDQKAKASMKQEILELLTQDELEDRLVDEIKKLKQDILIKKNEIASFSNIEQLEKQFEARIKELASETKTVRLQRDVYEAVIKGLQKHCEVLEDKLKKNSIDKELCVLEKQWQFLEGKNFEIQEFLDEANATGVYTTVKANTMIMIKQLNATLMEL